MHIDSHMLTIIERISAALEDAASSLAQKYEARLTTPYLEENLGDIRRAIQASKPTFSGPRKCEHCGGPIGEVAYFDEHGAWCDIVCAEGAAVERKGQELHGPPLTPLEQAEEAVVEAAKALEEHYSTAGISLHEQEQKAELVLALLEKVRALYGKGAQ